MPGVGKKGIGEELFHRYEVSFWDDEKVLELDSVMVA